MSRIPGRWPLVPLCSTVLSIRRSPNTLSGVIYQSGAFTCISDGQFNQPVAESACRAARDALNGVDPSGGAIYYFNPSTATSSWIWSRLLITVIGKHRFCS